MESAACSGAVRRKMAQRVADAANDPQLAEACAQEIEMLCYDYPPGPGNVHREFDRLRWDESNEFALSIIDGHCRFRPF